MTSSTTALNAAAGPVRPPSWVVRLVLVVLGLVGWFASQSLVASRPTPEGTLPDGLHELLAPVTAWLHAHPAGADALLIASSAVIDLLGLGLLAASIFGPTFRPFIGLLTLFALRQICQMCCALPIPEGMIWRSPGFPSLLVTYGVANDLFFSGHTAIAVYGAVELSRLPVRGMRLLGIAIIVFESFTVLALRAHYTMDVFTGIVTALLVADFAARVAPACDRALSRAFGHRLHDASAAVALWGVRWLIWITARTVFSLRYRVRIRGLEKLDDVPRGTLILPNHPGYIEPALMLVALYPRLRPRPMLYENNFQNPVLGPFAHALNALRVPDLETASMQARARARQAIDDAIAALRAGQNVLLYPAGRIMRSGREALGGTRAASDILTSCPEAKVLLVRTRGIWGSSWSYAYTGRQPPIFTLMLRGIGWLAANLIFFTPRRQVEITVEPIERDALPELRREVLNRWLEDWYNADGSEEPSFVPYHAFLGPRTHTYPPVAGAEAVDVSAVKPQTRQAIAELLAEKVGRALTDDEQQPETTLEHFGLDSIDRMELALRVEQRFGFSSDQAPVTIGQLWALAEGLLDRGPPRPAPAAWFRPSDEVGPLELLGRTVPEAFVARALAHRHEVAVADDQAGVQSYERLLIGALVLARRLKRLPASNVGLLLPASAACDMALLALYLADKLPVVLNWTTGPGNLAHAARVAGLTHVLTVHPFIDRTGITVEGTEYLYLEDLRRDVGRWELLRTLLYVRFAPGGIRRQASRANPDQPAVLLFTSGSERAPKAVPLTHANLLSNYRGGIPTLGLTRQDAMLGFLPAFHSFGFSGNILLPLLGGMRVVHHPDPTDAGGLARKIAAYRPTVLFATPTFLRHIFGRARPGELDSLRLISVGAEKCPLSLYEECARHAPNAVLLEGYGITECSPVVSTNAPGANRPGSLGRPLPEVEVAVVDLESGAAQPIGTQGMLLVRGPTIFPGYLGADVPAPFVEREGKRWYVTGDVARLDVDGFIWLAGRLKRFLKAGGEMVSLPALEEPLAQQYPPNEHGPRVAVEGIEIEGGRRIVLFTTEPLTLREANERLHEAGLRGVMRLDEVRRLDALPVLGTGKTDYRTLRAQIENGTPTAAAPGGSAGGAG